MNARDWRVGLHDGDLRPWESDKTVAGQADEHHLPAMPDFLDSTPALRRCDLGANGDSCHGVFLSGMTIESPKWLLYRVVQIPINLMSIE